MFRIVKTKTHFWNDLRQENIPLISVSVCSCITPPLPPSLALQAGQHSGPIQSRESWEGRLYRPYGEEVWYLSSLPELPVIMKFPHTRHQVWVSLLSPHFSPFILNSDKKGEREWRWSGVLWGETRGRLRRRHKVERKPRGMLGKAEAFGEEWKAVGKERRDEKRWRKDYKKFGMKKRRERKESK